MKKYLNLTALAAIAAALTFTACSSDNEQDKGSPFMPTPVQFSAGLNVGEGITRTLTYTGSPFAASSIGNVWVSNATAADADKVLLFTVNDKNGVSTTTTAGYPYYISNASNQLTPVAAANQFYWMKTGEAKGVVAWSHGQTAALAAADFDLDDTNHHLVFDLKTASGISDQSTSWNKELLWGYTVINQASSGSSQALNLYHQLARVDVILDVTGATAQPQLYIGRKDATAPASEEQLELNGNFTPALNHELNYDKNAASSPNTNWVATLANQYGTWASATSAENGYIKPLLVTTPASPSYPCDVEQEYSGVVIPHTYAADKFVLFQIDVDGVKYKYVPSAATTFAPGKRYIYKITVAPSGINVTASIQNWAHTGDATDEFTDNATLD